MRVFWAATAAAMLVCGSARAEGQPQTDSEASVGVGIICNTPDEAKQFVHLRGTGAKPDQAMNTVNAKAHDARGCGVAAIAYIRNGTVATTKLDNKLVQIIRINVVAGFNGSNWQPVSGMTQYAVLEGEGESV